MPSNFNQPIQTATDAATIPLNFAAAKAYKVTVAGSRTLVFNNADPDDLVVIRIIQDATGSRLITWPASVKWAAGTAPTLTITAAKSDEFMFYFDGASFIEKSRVLNF